MNYQITKQYKNDKQLLFAQVADLKQAKDLISAKLVDDAKINTKIIYRIYHHDEKIYEANPWNSRGIENNLLISKAYRYKVIQFIAPNNQLIIGEFDELIDAKKIIDARLAEDSLLNQEVSYRLYDKTQFHSEYNQLTLKQTDSQSEKNNALVFRPTPLPTTPAMGPRGFLIQKEDTDEESE